MNYLDLWADVKNVWLKDTDVLVLRRALQVKKI